MDTNSHEFLEWEEALAQGERVEELLDEEFREFGASGRVWTREDVTGAVGGDVALSDFSMCLLDTHVALVTYRARRDGADSLRSSVWVRRERGWRLVFHQGTRVS